MARLAAALLLLAACAAPRARQPDLEAPGLRLTVSDGKWSLLVEYAKDGSDEPTALFDENGGPDKAPPASRAFLPRAGFDSSKLPPAKGRPDSYHLMILSDAPAGAGERGVAYLHQRERGEAYPLLWWGLGEDPGLDGLAPRDALARLGALFPPKKKP